MGITTCILLLGAVSVCFAYVVKYGRNLLRMFYLSRKIPGPSLWELGKEYVKAKRMGDDVLTTTTRMCVSYGHKPWGLWTHFGYLLVVSDYASLSEVYKNKHLRDRSALSTDIIQRFMGKGVLTVNGSEHKLHRKIMGPAFRRPLLESMIPSFHQAAVNLIEMLKTNGSGEEVDVRFLVNKQIAKLLIISSSGFASAQRSDADEIIEGIPIISDVAAQTQLEMTNPLYYWLVYKRTKAYRKVHTESAAFLASYADFFREFYDHFMQEIEDGVDTTSGNWLQVMIRESLRFKVENRSALLLDEFKHIFVAGLETTAVTFNISLLLLALHPDVQQKVFQEIDSIFGLDDRPVQPEDLSKMVYLEMFIKETVRLFPPVPVFDREATEETVINNIRVPKGTKVMLHFMALHRDPRVFKDPLKFDPDRFSSESLDGRDPYGFIAFSTGAKACMGQEHAKLTLKTFLSHVVRNFEVLPGKKLKCVDDIKTEMQFALHLSGSSLCFVDRYSRNSHRENINKVL